MKDRSTTLIEEIQKRPFARPLFFWIAGILIYVCYPVQLLSLILLLPAVVALIGGMWVARQGERPMHFDKRWVWGVVVGCLFVFTSIQFASITEYRIGQPPQTNGLRHYASQVQTSMVEKLDRLQLSDDNKAMLASITVNYRKLMSRELRSRFSVTGVAHLLSVSGFHVGVVAFMLSGLLGLLPLPAHSPFRWVRFVLVLLGVWSFAYISGLSIPSVRAALMFSIYFTGKQLAYRTDSYNTLAVAAFCMLVWNPYYLFDVGFQLSFIAVFFILYLQPRLYRLIDVRNPLLAVPWGVLTVTVAAQTGTVFLGCYYFGQLSTVFLFTNLALSLLATVLIPVTLLYMLLPTGVPGYGGLQTAVERMAEGMMWIVDRFSNLPNAAIPIRFDFVTLIASYLLLGLLLYAFRWRSVPALLGALAVLLGVLCRLILIRL